MRADYVVYIHKCKDGLVRYVGSGTRTRANLTCANSNRGKKYKEFVTKSGNLLPEIVAENLTKQESLELEREVYYRYLGEYLLNARIPCSIKKEISREILSDLFNYDEAAPSCLTWKTNRHGRVKIGQTAGNVDGGYWRVMIQGKIYYVHRIVMALHGVVLEENDVVDHINGNRSDNRLTNLRVVDHKTNSRNKKKYRRLDDYGTGVSLDKKSNSFHAYVRNPDIKTKSGQSKLVTKIFSIKELGYDVALKMAKEARNDMLKELMEKGIEYSKSHMNK